MLRMKITAARMVPVFFYWGEAGLLLDIMLAIPKREKVKTL